MSSACSGFRPVRAWLAMAALLLVLGGGGLAALSGPAARADGNANYPQASLTAPTEPAALLARGKYLTLAADCMPCHTGPNRAPFSGGLVLNTPFGGLTTPNITPDKVTGIGNWTGTQFWNAVHDGIAPGHSYLVFPKYLYPAMPYTSYTKLSYADVMAIKAYLFSLPPVSAPPAANDLNFPFNQRPAMLGWRVLFFRPGPMHMKPGWDEAMKNSAYLTEALGHCQECHTPAQHHGRDDRRPRLCRLARSTLSMRRTSPRTKPTGSAAGRRPISSPTCIMTAIWPKAPPTGRCRRWCCNR